MNPLDLAIIATMVFLIIRGLMRGFFSEIGSIAGVILGIVFAYIYHPVMTEYIRTYLPNFRFLSFVSIAVIFTTVLIICNLGGLALKYIFKKTLFGWADRALGVGLAFLKGIILIYFTLVLVTFLVPKTSPLIA